MKEKGENTNQRIGHTLIRVIFFANLEIDQFGNEHTNHNLVMTGEIYFCYTKFEN